MIALAVVGTIAGPAKAVHHTTGGIQHGIHFEIRSPEDYHHGWTTHSHGKKSVGVYQCGSYWGTCYDGDSRCYNNNYTYTGLQHVHCTAYFDDISYAYHTTDNSATGCFGYDQPAPFYNDGHGMCAHSTDSWTAAAGVSDPMNEGDLVDWIEGALEGPSELPSIIEGEDVGFYGSGVMRRILSQQARRRAGS